MKVRLNSILRVLAAVLAAGLAASAQAAAGNGIRLGGSDARLHPFFDFETRYDSNVAYTASNQALSDVILHFKPGLEIKAPGDLAAVEFSGALDWAQYTGADGDTTGLSRLFAKANFAALFNRQGAVSARVDNAFTRQLSGTSLAAASSAVVSNMNVLSVGVPWRPSGGALVLTAMGQWTLETFEKYKDAPIVPADKLGYNQFRGAGEVQWRFLPRTTALFQAGYTARAPNTSGRPDDATGYDLTTGVAGLLTPRISASARVGYASLSAPKKTSGTVTADVGGEWLPLDTISVNAGYTRALGLDPTASTYVANGIKGGAKVKLASQWAAKLDARWDKLSFELIPGADTTFVRVEPGVEGTFGQWFNVGAGYVYTSRTASWPASAGGSPPDFSKNEVYARIGVTY